MKRTFILAAGIAFFASTFASANSPALSPKDEEEAVKLVRQLGHPSFAVRDSASNRLVEFGRAVEPVLRKGLANPEPEVRRRCERLIPLALHFDLEKQIQAFLADKDETNSPTLPGWKQFKAAAGNDDAARSLFVDMHRIDTEFMEMIEKDPKAAARKFKGKAEEMYNSVATGWGRITVRTDQVAFLLYPYLALQAQVDNNTQMYLATGFQNMAFQPMARAVLRDNLVIRKMLLAYLDQPNSPWRGSNISMIGQLELPEGIEIAKKLLKGKPDPYTKSTAIALLGKLGTKANLSDIEPFLKDNDNCGNVRFGNNAEIRSQVRDVALATSVQLSGQSLNDYNFPYVKMFGARQQNIQVFNSPTLFGFSDEATRNAAFKKWHEWREKNK